MGPDTEAGPPVPGEVEPEVDAAVEVEVGEGGATVRLGGVVRATFTGDLADEAARRAFGEMVAELFRR